VRKLKIDIVSEEQGLVVSDTRWWYIYKTEEVRECKYFMRILPPEESPSF